MTADLGHCDDFFPKTLVAIRPNVFLFRAVTGARTTNMNEELKNSARYW